jgi:cytochrome c biogenesis protein CcdA/glutaredoxin
VKAGLRRSFAWIVLPAVLILGVSARSAEDAQPPHLVIFWAEGCPYCEAELEFLDELGDQYPTLVIARHEVGNSQVNRELFVAAMEALGEGIDGVPTTILDDRVWVGFNADTATSIELAVGALLGGEPQDDDAVVAAESVIALPFVGTVDVAGSSLLVSTVLIAFVDGFNPCSLWVLTILLALVLNMGSRRRLLAVGGVFLAITTLLYGVYIIGFYSVLSYIAYVGWIRVAVAALALTFGIINVKDYFAFGRGPSLTISEKRKPELYRRIRRVAMPDRPLLPVLGGTAALAVGVSLIETPCTAGFPVLWADLLAERGVALGGAVVLFAVYMIVFLIDELLVFGSAVVAMRVTKVTERHGRVLKLVGGSVMIVLAAVLLFAPELMESVTGALAVFVGALAMAGVIVAIEGALRPAKPRLSR